MGRIGRGTDGGRAVEGNEGEGPPGTGRPAQVTAHWNGACRMDPSGSCRGTLCADGIVGYAIKSEKLMTESSTRTSRASRVGGFPKRGPSGQAPCSSKNGIRNERKCSIDVLV